MSSTSAVDSSLYLAIDQGGHASRALVFDRRGELLASAYEEIATDSYSDRVEHDAGQLLQSVFLAINAVVKHLGQDAERLHSAGLATQRSSMVCWDRQSGASLSPVLSWQDRRAAHTIDAMQAEFSRLQAISGLYPNAHFGASKMHWCLRHLSAVQSAREAGRLCIGPLASYLLFHLLEQQPFVCDVANAQRTLLMDVQRQEWSEYLLRQFDIPERVLPSIRPTRREWGRLDIPRTKVPLRICTGDQSAALFAGGWPRAEEAWVNLGTGGFVQLPLRGAVDSGRLLLSCAYAGEANVLNVLEGTVNGAGRALQWFAEQYQLDDLPSQLKGWLDKVTEPDVFMNGISGLGSPYWTSMESHFLDDKALPAKAVAVLESVLFLVQQNLACMPKPEVLRLSGGLSAMDGLCQRLANLSALPVRREIQGEATARGLAYLLAEQPPAWSSQAGDVFLPRVDGALQRRYQRWSAAMPDVG